MKIRSILQALMLSSLLFGSAAFAGLSATDVYQGALLLAQADGSHNVHQHSAPAPADRAQANKAMAEGEVTKIDKQAGKIIIKHDPIAKFDMPGMTMAFRVSEAAILDQVKPGDKIKFETARIKGAYTVLRIDSIK